MALFDWKDEYSVKVRDFDNHHKQLIKLLNELHEGMVQRKGTEVVGKVLVSLIDYTKYHFNEEELQMKKLNYSGYVNHKTEHDNLVKQVIDLKTRYDKGSALVTMTTMNFLKNWLTNHIMGTDKLYSEFFNGNGIK